MGRSMRMGLLIAVMVLAGSVDRAFALGIGGFLRAAGGSAEGEYDPDSGGEFDVEADPRYAGLGFVLDVHALGDSRFSYRLDLGIEKLDMDLEIENSSSEIELDLRGFAMEHSFAFALLRQDRVRLWIGPQLRVGFYGGDSELPFGVDGDPFVAELGLGCAFGANFKVADGFAIGGMVGIRAEGYGGINEWRSEEDEFTAGGGTVFFNVAFMGLVGSDG